MALSHSIRAGAAYIELYVRDNRLVRGLTAASRRLRRFSGSVSGIGRGMLKLSAAMGAPFAGGVKVYADFEKQMAEVSTMLDEPEKYMDAFRKGVRGMAVEFGESTDTLARGLYDILSASVDPARALDVLAVSARAAKAGLTDTGTAADAITTILNAYGLSADRAADVSDLLFTIVRRGKLTFSDLAPNIGKIASIAASAGLSLDELGAALAAMTRNGVQAENAVTALTAIVSTFLKPSAEASEYARQLGFNLDAATLRAKGLEGVFARIGKLPPDAISKLFPNIRALRGVLPAMRNMEGFSADLEAMADRAGATGRAYEKMTRTLSHRFAQLKQVAVQAFVAIGEAVADSAGKAADKFLALGKAVVRFISENRNLVVTVSKVVLAIGAAGAALVTLGAGAAALSTILGGMASVIAGLGTVIGAVGSALAFLVTPIGAVIAALAGLGAYFLYASDAGVKAADWLARKFDDLKSRALESFRAISDALAAGDIALAARVLWLALKAEFMRGVNVLKGYWIDFKGFFIDAWNTAVYGTLTIATEVWAKLRSLWNDAIAGMTKALNRFITVFKTSWNSLNGWVEEAFTRMFLYLDGFDEAAREKAAQEIRQRVRRENEATVDESVAVEREILRDRDRKNAAVKQALDTDRQAILDAWNQERDASSERYRRQREANDAALEAARREWRAAVEAAKKAREQAEKQKKEASGIEKPKPPELTAAGDALAGLTEQLRGLGETAVQQAEAVVGVKGTFSAEAVHGLEAGGAAERTAKATEETARNTKQLLREAKSGGLVFA